MRVAVEQAATIAAPTSSFEGGRPMFGFMRDRLGLLLVRLCLGQEGQGLTEYALVLALIAVVAVAAMSLLGGRVTSVLSTVAVRT